MKLPKPKIDSDDVDRRGFLNCMAWAGAGVVWTMSGGIARSRPFDDKAIEAGADFHFVQISDSHIGFHKPANTDVTATLKTAVSKINALHTQPEFVMHTGDLTHSSKAEEFDTLQQLLRETKAGQILYVPGEHDTSVDGGAMYLERFGKGTKGTGWYSFDQKGVHFVSLVNVVQLEGMGNLGDDQLKWLKDDLSGRSSSTPVVVFAHIPLWTVYAEWGWGTKDSEQALALLKRFGSVTVLNGHIHQVMQKVEGNIAFHTAMSTAFPQPKPGEAPSPGPMKVPDDRLRSVLGVAEVSMIRGNHRLAVVDSTLADGGAAGA